MGPDRAKFAHRCSRKLSKNTGGCRFTPTLIFCAPRDTDKLILVTPESGNSVDFQQGGRDDKEEEVLQPVDQDFSGQEEGVGDRKEGGHQRPVHVEQADPVEVGPKRLIILTV